MYCWLEEFDLDIFNMFLLIIAMYDFLIMLCYVGKT